MIPIGGVGLFRQPADSGSPQPHAARLSGLARTCLLCSVVGPPRTTLGVSRPALQCHPCPIAHRDPAVSQTTRFSICLPGCQAWLLSTWLGMTPWPSTWPPSSMGLCMNHISSLIEEPLDVMHRVNPGEPCCGSSRSGRDTTFKLSKPPYILQAEIVDYPCLDATDYIL